MKISLLPILLCLLAAGPSAPARAQNGGADLTARLAEYRFGADTAVLDDIAKEVAAARSNPTRRRRIAHDLALFLRSGAAFDAKQFACRQLVFVAGPEQAPALAALLRSTGSRAKRPTTPCSARCRAATASPAGRYWTRWRTAATSAPFPS
jgi:hypothetical protein